MQQKILSTLENKVKQKSSTFYSSSTVFWGVLDRKKNIDTSISLLNHFLLKRGIKSVTLRLSVRDLTGKLITENLIEINKPQTYTFSLSKLLPLKINKGEFSLFAEFISNENLAIPFCAVSMVITSPKTIDHVHTYGRAIEVNEINTPIDFPESFESGWTIHPKRNIKNFAILHTGRIFSEINISLKLFKTGKEFFRNELLPFKLNPFATLKIDFYDSISNSKNFLKIKKIISESNYGEIDAKIKIKGLKGSFPRMLFVATAKSNKKEKASSSDFDYINFTHSNFDFDSAEQPKSSEDFGFINNPAYPNEIEECGFRYYPCKDLKEINFQDIKQSINTLPIFLTKLSSTKVVSNQNIPSRVVGTNWVKWKESPIIGDCSTGTFIIEYSNTKSYWHWGLLNPSPTDFNSIISLLNPFSLKEEVHNFELYLYDAKGLILKKNIKFVGSSYSIDFDKNNFSSTKETIWYALLGEGVGSFNIFSTISFQDKRDGSIEHAF